MTQELRISAAMEDAKVRLKKMTEDPGNDTKLKMYALFKQATTGPCNIKKPGVFDFIGQAKWNAWNDMGTMSQEEAEKEYILLVNSLVGEPFDAMEDAKKRLKKMTDDPGNDTKLKLYALFKQATSGPCNIPKPGVFDFIGQAKWNAWNDIGNISKEEAQQEYISLVNSLVGGPEASTEEEAVETPAEAGVEGLSVENIDGVCRITLNRPRKYNALTGQMYVGIADALNAAAVDDSVKFAVLTGEGDYYCSGNDLSNFTQMPEGGVKQIAKDSKNVLLKFQSAFIKFPKPLVCGVNGPAIGIAVTLLGLVDTAYASDTATFHTPFMSLGQSPEGCSSYTFPKIMGPAKANEILMMGKKLTAKEALERNLISEIFPKAQFKEMLQEKIDHMNSLPAGSLRFAKKLSRDREVDFLERVNEEECVQLEERWQSEDCKQAVIKFLTRKSKL